MPHNPENIPLTELPPGYRFLEKNEYVRYTRDDVIEFCLEEFDGKLGWLNAPAKHAVGFEAKNWTYRTKLTKNKLAKYRFTPRATKQVRRSNPQTGPIVGLTSGTKLPRAVLTRTHFELLARQIRKTKRSRRVDLVRLFLPALQATNPRFNEDVFRKSAGAEKTST